MLDKTAILKEAQKLLSKGALDKAISELDKLVKDFPDGNIFNMIGDIHLKKGNQKAATEYYRKAAIFFWHEGFSQKAQALFKKVLNINPADTDALFAFGEISEEKGLVTDAIKYYLATADLLAKEGKKDKILSIYEKILSLSPANIPLRIKVADMFIKEGLKSEASRELVRVAHIYNEQGDGAKAKEFFQKTLDLQPLNKEAFLGLNHIIEKTGDIQQAVDHMKEAAVLFPEDKDILSRCTDMALRIDNYGLAKECLVRITQKDPRDVRARSMLGQLYRQAGAREQSWEQYLPVLDEFLAGCGSEDAVSFLAEFREMDPIETGKRLIALFRQQGDNNSCAEELLILSDLLEKQGMEEDAKVFLAEAELIAPEHPEVRKRLAPPEPEQPAPVTDNERVDHPEFAEPEFTEEKVLVEPAGEGAFETGGKSEPEQISIRSVKSFEEVITEADIFARYGLLTEAQRLLEGLKQRFPENIDVHLRLKSVYLDIHNKEAAVTECIILSELFKRKGDVQNSEQALKDAFEINPEDPRIAERGFSPLLERTSFASQTDGFGAAVAPRDLNIDDYEEEIAEADFYARQGLTTEAVKILERLHALFPENRDIFERLQSLGQTTASASEEFPGSIDAPEPYELPETVTELQELNIPEGFATAERHDSGTEGDIRHFELPELDEAIDNLELIAEQAAGPVSPSTPEETSAGEESAIDISSGIAEEAETPQYEEFSVTDPDLVDAQDMPEPSLDNDVLEIFQEFKKGLEKELGDEDSETHYNLGIAYKEMGLVDDAIKEFQTSRNDPRRFIQSSTMLGVCYMEKGLNTLAIDVLKEAVEGLKEKDESYRAIQYDLADAYERNNNLREALDLYTEVYGWNAKFRSVSDKIGRLRTIAPAAPETASREDKPKRKDRVSYL